MKKQSQQVWITSKCASSVNGERSWALSNIIPIYSVCFLKQLSVSLYCTCANETIMFVTVSVIAFTEITRNVPFLGWTDALSTVAGTWNHKNYYSQSNSTATFKLENNNPSHTCAHIRTCACAQNCCLRGCCIKENNQAKSLLSERILLAWARVWWDVTTNALILLFHLIRTHIFKLSFGFRDLQSGLLFPVNSFFLLEKLKLSLTHCYWRQ